MTEAVMFFFAHQFESVANVDPPRGVQHVVRPQHHLLVAGAAGEADAFLDETIADATASRKG